MGNAAKVGAFVTAFVILLIGAYAVLGQRLFKAKTTRYFATFDDANGATKGTPVLVAGVKIGQVDEIGLAKDGRTAQLTLSVDAGNHVLQGTTAVVPSSLVGLGAAPITLVPPVGSAPDLPADSVIPGHKGSPLDSVLPNSKETVASVNALLVELRKVVKEGGFQKRANSLLANTDRTITKFGNLADNLDRTLARNQSSIDASILRGSQAIADVQRITYQVAKLVEKGTLQNDVTGILAQLKETSKKADTLVASMNRLVADPNLTKITSNVAALTESSKTIAKNVGELTETGKSIAKNADAASANGVTISKNVADATARAKEVTDNAIEIEKSVKTLLDKVNKIVPDKGPGGIKAPPVALHADFEHSGDLDRSRLDVTARVGLGQNFADVGLWDAFEGDKLILQYGHYASPALAYRYGIYAGKPGVGVDYRLLPRVSLRADAWDLSTLR